MEKIIYEKPYAKIFYDEEHKMMIIRWKGFVTSEQYREIFSKTADFVIENHIPRLLADAREQGPVSPADRKWLETEVMPKVIPQGFKYSASVISKDIFQEYYLRQIKSNSKMSGIFDLQYFDDYQKAYEWITNTDIS